MRAVSASEDDGYLIVIEGSESDAGVEAEVGDNLREALYEGGFYEHGCFVTATLHNNQYGISWVVIDGPQLDPAIRAKLVEECGEAAPDPSTRHQGARKAHALGGVAGDG